MEGFEIEENPSSFIGSRRQPRWCGFEGTHWRKVVYPFPSRRNLSIGEAADVDYLSPRAISQALLDPLSPTARQSGSDGCLEDDSTSSRSSSTRENGCLAFLRRERGKKNSRRIKKKTRRKIRITEDEGCLDSIRFFPLFSNHPFAHLGSDFVSLRGEGRGRVISTMWDTQQLELELESDKKTKNFSSKRILNSMKLLRERRTALSK